MLIEQHEFARYDNYLAIAPFLRRHYQTWHGKERCETIMTIHQDGETRILLGQTITMERTDYQLGFLTVMYTLMEFSGDKIVNREETDPNVKTELSHWLDSSIAYPYLIHANRDELLQASVELERIAQMAQSKNITMGTSFDIDVYEGSTEGQSNLIALSNFNIETEMLMAFKEKMSHDYGVGDIVTHLLSNDVAAKMQENDVKIILGKRAPFNGADDAHIVRQ